MRENRLIPGPGVPSTKSWFQILLSSPRKGLPAAELLENPIVRLSWLTPLPSPRPRLALLCSRDMPPGAGVGVRGVTPRLWVNGLMSPNIPLTSPLWYLNWLSNRCLTNFPQVSRMSRTTLRHHCASGSVDSKSARILSAKYIV